MPKYNIIILSLSNQEGMTARNGWGAIVTLQPLQAKAQARLKVAQEVEEEAARKAGWISAGG